LSPADIDTRKILVVEDEPAISLYCSRVLSAEGFYVQVAENSMVAQNMVKETEYDVLLLDIRMPVMDGMELYQWLEKEYGQMAQKVIFTTGSVMSGGATGFIEETGRPFLPKPFTPRELTAIIKETLKEIAE